MLVEKVIGNINDEQFKNSNIDYVDIEWHEAFKKLHRKTSQSGIEVGIKLDNDILTRGLRQGDVLAINEDNVIAVNIPKDKALVVKVDLSLIGMPVSFALSVSFGVIISVYFKSSSGILSIAGAGFKMVILPAFLAILKAAMVTSIGVSN